MIYLDNAATTQVNPDLKPIIDGYLYRRYGNPGSLHGFGSEISQDIQVERESIAALFGASADGVIFTSSGSEANTMVILGLEKQLKKTGNTHIITTKYEHHSVLNAVKEMESRGFEVTYLDVPDGTVKIQDFQNALRPNTGLVSIMCVNNEIGTSNYMWRIYEICKKREIFLHSDCVQAVCEFKLDLPNTADFITFSGHKIHAPKGIGCVLTSKKEYLSNIIFGGEQEFGLRPGTENTAFIAAFAKQLRAQKEIMYHNPDYIWNLRDAFIKRLGEECVYNGVLIKQNIAETKAGTRIISLQIPGVDAETLILELSNRGVYVSAGAACDTKNQNPSHVLKAIGLTDEEARSTIRVSFSDYNTKTEVEKAAWEIVNCAKELLTMGK